MDIPADMSRLIFQETDRVWADAFEAAPAVAKYRQLQETRMIADKWQVLSVATLALSQLEATLKPCRLIQWSWLPNSVLMAALVARGSEFVASAEWLALDSGGWPMPRRVCRQGIRRGRRCLGQSGVQHDELGARGLSPKS